MMIIFAQYYTTIALSHSAYKKRRDAANLGPLCGGNIALP